jgi:hypothetical protein
LVIPIAFIDSIKLENSITLVDLIKLVGLVDPVTLIGVVALIGMVALFFLIILIASFLVCELKFLVNLVLTKVCKNFISWTCKHKHEQMNMIESF